VQIVGHAAVGALLGRRLALPRRGRWLVLLGALTPDLLDKPAVALGLTTFGRALGHAPVTWMLVMSGWWLLARQARDVRHWLIGVGSHLLADLADDALRGVLYSGYALDGWVAWPLIHSGQWYLTTTPLGLGRPWWPTPLEVGVLGAAAFLLWRARGAPGELGGGQGAPATPDLEDRGQQDPDVESE
jgi:hypothetical protein